MRLGIDATRISDGRPVVLKRLLLEEGPYELQINRLFSTEPLASNSRNHCVRMLDVIELPGDQPIMVHPLLRQHYDPPIGTIGEFITFLAQICEVRRHPLNGVARPGKLTRVGRKLYARTSCRPSVCSPLYINLAHDPTIDSDCTYENIMLDPSGMYPNSFHPADPRKSKEFRRKAKGYSRTRRPTRYHLIDFGLSRLYDPAIGPPLDQPLRGGDKSAPEHQDGKTPCNPFPTDVYYLGNLVREDYMQVQIIFYHFFVFQNSSDFYKPEIPWPRIHATAYCRYGPRRPDEAPRHG